MIHEKARGTKKTQSIIQETDEGTSSQP